MPSPYVPNHHSMLCSWGSRICLQPLTACRKCLAKRTFRGLAAWCRKGTLITTRIRLRSFTASFTNWFEHLPWLEFGFSPVLLVVIYSMTHTHTHVMRAQPYLDLHLSRVARVSLFLLKPGSNHQTLDFSRLARVVHVSRQVWLMSGNMLTVASLTC